MDPRVSIAIPVRNGENYLAAAIESVLAQSFEDYELILADNASTDATAEICRRYVARDGRVRWDRSDRNLGAVPNHNRAVALARADYFKWLAHDDLLEPGFLGAALEALEADPGAILCQSLIRFVDENGCSLGVFDSALAGAGSPSPSVRFGTLVLSSHPCTELTGLIRRDPLAQCGLPGGFHGADRALLARLALRGRFAQLDRPLVKIREHAGRYTRSRTRPAERQAWHGHSGTAAAARLATWRLYADYLRAVRGESLNSHERRRCHVHLARWWLRNWNAVRIAVDAIALVVPGFLGFAERVKITLFGAAPGHFVGRRDGRSDRA